MAFLSCRNLTRRDTLRGLDLNHPSTRLPLRRTRFLNSLTALIALLPCIIHAQETIHPERLNLVKPRIVTPIDDASLVRVPDSAQKLTGNATDLGRMDSNARIGPFLMVLRSTSQQEQVLHALLDQQQDRYTANYHKWLTPGQFGVSFGVADSDIDKLTQWLSSHGLTVTKVSKGKRSLLFQGTSANIEATFHTTMHRVGIKGKEYFANTQDISLPAAVTSLVKSVGPLNNFSAMPTYTGIVDLISSGNYLSPGDFATIYNTEPILEQGIDGTGVTIGIAGESDINPSDALNFRSTFLPAKYANNAPALFNSSTDPGRTGTDSEAEGDLDVEWAGAVAPGASIILNATTDPIISAEYFVDTNIADIISVSFAQCEAYSEQAEDSIWEQAAAQGITVFVAAGDSGSAGAGPTSGGCDDPNSESAATQGYGVNAYASTPYNVAVGGTEFVEDIATTPGWKDNNYTTTFGMPYTSAQGYIAEEVWNESSVNGGSGIWAGGGGVSTLYGKPSWQAGDQVPTSDPITVTSSVPGPHRYLPDVSLTAANHDGYLICSEVGPANCGTGGPITGTFARGTSAATPAFAGIQALIDQTYGRQGQAAYTYYALAAQQDLSTCASDNQGGPASTCIFNDVQLGSNSVPCQAGSTDCVNNVLPMFLAAPGYDLATGLGSVNAYNLYKQWNSETVRSADTAIQIVTPSNGSSTYGSAVTLEAAVSIPVKAWGPPLTGTSVAFTDQSSGETIGTQPLQLDITSDTYTATLSTSSLAVGTHSISANCQLTGVYTSYYICVESSPVTVTVIAAGTAPTANTGSATSVSSTNATLNGTVNPNGARTQYQFLYGTSQTLAGASTSGPYSLAAGTSTQPVYATISGLSASKTYYYELQAWNSANSISNPTNGGILSFPTPSTAKSTPLVSVAPSSQSITTTQLLAVSVAVVGNSATPTGSVVLSGGGYNSSAPLANGSVIFNISAGQLLAGSDTLTATYTPDSASSSIYNSSTGNTTVSVTTPGKLTPTVSVSPLSTSITTAQSVTVNVLVSTSSGPSPTGTVTVTIGSYTSQAMPLTNANASVIISGSSLSPGTYTPTAHYSGDTNFNGATGTANNSVTVTAAPTATLTVSISGSGSVSSTDGHINCPGTCSYGYAFDTSVLLKANEASGYYDQWSGCDGIDGSTGGCMLTMNQSRTVSIVFTQQPKGIMLVQPGNYTFAPLVIGTSYTWPELVIANGGAALDQVFASLGGPNAADFGLNNQCQSYGVNSNCYIYVTFTPSAVGTRSASLTVSSANATITPQVFSLSGAGVANPTVNVTQSATSISANQALTLDVSVSGPYGTPTGSLRVNGGGYNLTGVPLNNGNAEIEIPGGVLAQGADTIWVYYDPDSSSSAIYNYTSGTSVSVTVAGATSYSAPSEPIGTQSPVQTATILFANSVTPGSITATTLGATNLDFNLASGGTCAVGTAYTAGQTCTVNYTFTPSAPGTRMGAINVYDNASPAPHLVSTVYVNGMGTGPQVAFSPGVQSTILPLIIQENPGGIAVDGSGNLYIADSDNNEVLKETLSGGKYAESTIGSSWNQPRSIAVDGAGAVYVAESGMNRVVMETPSGGSYVQSTVASGLGYPSGVAVDGSGNVYIADSQNNQILMETLTASGYVQSTIPSSGLSWPNGIAVDGSGDIYIADQYNNRVLKETLSGGSYTQSTIIGSLNNPRGVAVDPNGDVYIADSQDNQVLEETPSTSGYVESMIGSGVSYPCWVTLDGSGNLFISGYNLLKEDVSDPPSVSFESTASGSTSADSPKTITLANIGNAPLTFQVPSSGSNPSISANFTVDKSTTCPQLSQNSAQGALAAGASCKYALDFSPTGGGNVSGSLVVSDNNLNAANGVQTITLSGIGTWVATITVNPASSSITTTQVLPVTITVSGGAGSPTPTGTVTISSGSYISSVTALSGGSATINVPAGSLAVGSDTLSATYTPDSGSSSIYTTATGTTSSAVIVTATAPTVTVTPASSSITTTQALSVTVTVSGGTGSPTATGTVKLSSGNYASAATPLSGGTATINIPATSLAAGSDTLTATYTPDNGSSSIYTGATGTASSAVTVTATAPTVTVTPGSTSITTTQALSVTVAVSGGTGNPTATGTVKLSSGSYASAVTALSGGTATINIPAASLSAGSDTLSATYTPDSGSSSIYTGATGTASSAVTVTATAPTVTVTPGSTSITTTQALSVTVTVSGGTSNPTATGTVKVSSGTYSSAATALSGGTATITIPGGTLTASSYTFKANYAPDSAGSTIYTTATGTAASTVTVTAATPTVTVTPGSSSITTAQALSVTVTVSGGTGSPTGTGTVKLSSGSYTSAATALSGGSATIKVPAGSLTLGSDTLSATYTPDSSSSSIYTSASGTAPVTVTTPQTATPTFSPLGGTYTSSQSVTISDATPGAAIYYTTNGTTPTTSSTLYSGAITVSSTETLEVIATASGYTQSGVATATYTINIPANPVPVISGLSPAYASTGSAAFTLTVKGSGFITTSTVYWGSTALSTQYGSATQLTAQVTAAQIAAAGISTITVQTPAPGGGTSNSLQFEVDSAGSGTPPTFTTVTATVAPGSTATYPVTLASSATFDSVNCLNLPTGALCSYSSTSNTLTITTSSTTPAGTYQITVVFTETLPGASTGFILLPILLLPLVILRKKLAMRGIWLTTCVGLVLLTVLAFNTGCGGGGGGGGSTPPQTHQGTSSGTVALTIQ